MSIRPEKEKQAVALSSALAAVFLTLLKIVVGLSSGSLGILAEAAHSAMDLIAALLTLLAVHVSGRPADTRHQYGHGKIENLSALMEVVLLLLTCGWIITEAGERLLNRHAQIQASLWAFGVLFIAMGVDLTRSRMLSRAASRHRSQALEADALHFRTDIWSSAVVVAGLAGVKVAESNPALGFLVKADALAALLVAGLVVGVSLRLGGRTIQGLMDTAPAGISERITKAVENMEGVRNCHAVRVRESGPRSFVDLHVLLDADLSLELAHELTDRIESKVRQLVPEADVTVHPEPFSPAPQAGDDPSI